MDIDNGWIELKEGNEMPDYDENVLWYYEDGTMWVDALDKDGNPHIFGYDIDELPDHVNKEIIMKMPKATHWMPLPSPPKTSDK